MRSEPFHPQSLATRTLGVRPDDSAPDGSDVRLLVSVTRGSMAHFELAPGCTSRAVRHHTVDEVWFFVAGRGEIWRRLGDDELIVPAIPGVAVSIPVGTSFQFRCLGPIPLAAVGTTMPPWPGESEAEPVDGPWSSSFEVGSDPRP